MTIPCPNCGGAVSTRDNWYDAERGAVYRIKKCKECCLIFFTYEQVAKDPKVEAQIRRYCNNKRNNRKG